MNKRIFKRIGTLVLTAALCFQSVPMNVFAEDGSAEIQTEASTEVQTNTKNEIEIVTETKNEPQTQTEVTTETTTEVTTDTVNETTTETGTESETQTESGGTQDGSEGSLPTVSGGDAHTCEYIYADNGDGTHKGTCSCEKETESSKHEESAVSNSDGTHCFECSVCGYLSDSISCEEYLASVDNNDDETHTVLCTICGYQHSVEEHEYDFENGVIDKENMLITYTCIECGYEATAPYQGVLAECTHELAYTANNDGTHNKSCATCATNETENCTYKNGICTYCNATDGTVMAHGAKAGIAWVVSNDGVLTLTGEGLYTISDDISSSNYAEYIPWSAYGSSVTHVVADCVLPQNASYFFYGIKASTIEFGSNFSSSKVCYMDAMFGCSGFLNLDLSDWDTSNLLNCPNLFYNSEVEYLNLSGWNFSGYSYNDESLVGNAFQWSNWLYGNDSLKEVDFSYCDFSNRDSIPSVASVDISSQDYENLPLEKINFSHIEAPNVTDISKDSVSLWSWGPENFEGLPNLKEVDFSHSDFSSITSFANWFSEDISLTKVDFTGATFGQIVSTESMFSKCTSFTDFTTNVVKMDKLDFTQNKTVKSMFEGCTSIKKVDFSAFEMPVCETMSSAFSECRALTDMIFNSDFTGLLYMNSTFYNCVSLPSVNCIDVLPLNQIQQASRLFQNCDSLEEITVLPGEWNSLVTAELMFCDCDSIDTLDLSAIKGSFSTYRPVYTCDKLTRVKFSDDGVVINSSESSAYELLGGEVSDGSPFWADYDDDNMTAHAYMCDGSTYSGWYSILQKVNVFGYLYNENGAQLKTSYNYGPSYNSEADSFYTALGSFYQQALSTNTALNRNIPMPDDSVIMKKSQYDYGAGTQITTQAFWLNEPGCSGKTYIPSGYVALPYGEDYQTYNPNLVEKTQYINRLPITASSADFHYSGLVPYLVKYDIGNMSEYHTITVDTNASTYEYDSYTSPYMASITSSTSQNSSASDGYGTGKITSAYAYKNMRFYYEFVHPDKREIYTMTWTDTDGDHSIVLADSLGILAPNDDYAYEYVMPDADVTIKLTLEDIERELTAIEYNTLENPSASNGTISLGSTESYTIGERGSVVFSDTFVKGEALNPTFNLSESMGVYYVAFENTGTEENPYYEYLCDGTLTAETAISSNNDVVLYYTITKMYSITVDTSAAESIGYTFSYEPIVSRTSETRGTSYSSDVNKISSAKPDEILYFYRGSTGSEYKKNWYVMTWTDNNGDHSEYIYDSTGTEITVSTAPHSFVMPAADITITLLSEDILLNVSMIEYTTNDYPKASSGSIVMSGSEVYTAGTRGSVSLDSDTFVSGEDLVPNFNLSRAGYVNYAMFYNSGTDESPYWNRVTYGKMGEAISTKTGKNCDIVIYYTIVPEYTLTIDSSGAGVHQEFLDYSVKKNQYFSTSSYSSSSSYKRTQSEAGKTIYFRTSLGSIKNTLSNYCYEDFKYVLTYTDSNGVEQNSDLYVLGTTSSLSPYFTMPEGDVVVKIVATPKKFPVTYVEVSDTETASDVTGTGQNFKLEFSKDYDAGTRGGVIGPEYIYYSPDYSNQFSAFYSKVGTHYMNITSNAAENCCVSDIMILADNGGSYSMVNFCNEESTTAFTPSGVEFVLNKNIFPYSVSSGLSGYVVYYTMEESISFSYTVSLPAMVELAVSEDGQNMTGDMNVGIKYIVGDEDYINISIDSGSRTLTNQLGEELTVVPSKEKMTWTSQTSGVTEDSEGNLVGSDKFTLTTDFAVGEWKGNLVVNITPGKTVTE